MNFLVLACGGPNADGFALLLIGILLAGALVVGSMGGSFVLGIVAYARRSLPLSIASAVLAALNLVVAVHVPMYLMAVFVCLALAVAAAARSWMHTA